MVFVLALGAALANALTSIFQRMGVEKAPESATLRLRLIVYAVHKRVWLLGFALMIVSFLLQATALHLGRLSQAWSQGNSGCAASPSQSAEGGAAPYWDQYSYASTGNLTSQTSTPQSGAATTTMPRLSAQTWPWPSSLSSVSSAGARRTRSRRAGTAR